MAGILLIKFTSPMPENWIEYVGIQGKKVFVGP